MIRLRIVRSVFSLKINVGGSICPYAVADKRTVRCFFHCLKNEPHTLSPFFTMHFDGLMPKNADYQQVKRNTAVFGCLKYRLNFSSEKLSSQPQLAENDEL